VPRKLREVSYRDLKGKEHYLNDTKYKEFIAFEDHTLHARMTRPPLRLDCDVDVQDSGGARHHWHSLKAKEICNKANDIARSKHTMRFEIRHHFHFLKIRGKAESSRVTCLLSAYPLG
jgi:hypothetical protein